MRKVLIVDDEPSIRFVLARTCERVGVAFEEAGSAEEAREKLRDVGGGKNGIGLVLLDVRLPGDDGFKLLGEIGGRTDSPFIVVMTAEDTMRSAVEAMKRGAADYLGKPFDLARVERLVKDPRDAAHARAAPRSTAGAGRAARPRGGAAPLPGDRAPGDAHRPLGGDDRGLQGDRPRRAHRDDRPAHGRVGHRQGARRARHPRELHARARPLRHGQHGRDPEGPHRERAVRPREGLVHRRASSAARASSSSRAAARSSSTRLASCRSSCRRSSCACCRSARSTGSAARGRCPSTCGSSRRRTPTSARSVEEGRFRRDLYYRLAVVPDPAAPAARARGRRRRCSPATSSRSTASSSRGGPLTLGTDAEPLLLAHPWPGNVRELQNVIQRALLKLAGHARRREGSRRASSPRRQSPERGLAGLVESVLDAPPPGGRPLPGRARRARGAAHRRRARAHRREPAPRGRAPRHEPQHAPRADARARDAAKWLPVGWLPGPGRRLPRFERAVNRSAPHALLR